MSRPTVIDHNVLTDEVIEREMNDVEFAEWQARVAEGEAEKAAEAKAKTDRTALLARLGITEEEAQLLLN